MCTNLLDRTDRFLSTVIRSSCGEHPGSKTSFKPSINFCRNMIYERISWEVYVSQAVICTSFINQTSGQREPAWARFLARLFLGKGHCRSCWKMIDDTSRRAPMVAATGEQLFMSNFTSSETLRILNLMIGWRGSFFKWGEMAWWWWNRKDWPLWLYQCTHWLLRKWLCALV